MATTPARKGACPEPEPRCTPATPPGSPTTGHILADVPVCNPKQDWDCAITKKKWWKTTCVGSTMNTGNIGTTPNEPKEM